ncbi:hypothetical protein KFK09_025501 [Dendrobium nobile]|uniref:Uncharacterized protein n=1 Tax=Dendrobium nobile TaxID=94219 RepID=A0A8T3AH46_DENNO|nr:hypothetical protein KFK09_025501 [Dendrobium nobile]
MMGTHISAYKTGAVNMTWRSEEGPGEDSSGEDMLRSLSEWLLPAKELDGSWERIDIYHEFLNCKWEGLSGAVYIYCIECPRCSLFSLMLYSIFLNHCYSIAMDRADTSGFVSGGDCRLHFHLYFHFIFSTADN